MKKTKAFTLAEVLITMGVLGAVALFMIPSVVIDIRENSYRTQRQAFAANIREVMQAASMEGGSLSNVTTALDFVEKRLSPVMMLSKICSARTTTSGTQTFKNIEDCGFDTSVTDGYALPNITGRFQMPTTKSGLNTTAGGNEFTQDFAGAIAGTGISMIIGYNPGCHGDTFDSKGSLQSQMTPCVNIIFDVNGTDPPNIVGQDIGFLSVFNARAPRIGAPLLHNIEPVEVRTKEEALGFCKGVSSRGDLGLPTREEAISLQLNSLLLTGSNKTTGFLRSKTIKGEREITSGYIVCVGR